MFPFEKLFRHSKTILCALSRFLIYLKYYSVYYRKTKLRACMHLFKTSRLVVGPWATFSESTSAHTPEQFLAGLLGDSEVHAQLPWHDINTTEKARMWLQEEAGGDTYPIYLIDTHECIGFVGIVGDIKNVSVDKAIEIGYVLHKSFWGRGFATEVVGGLILWLKSRGVRSLEGYAAADNLGSQKVLQKNGFKPGITVTHRNVPRIHFELLK